MSKPGTKSGSSLGGFEYYTVRDYKSLLSRRKWLLLTTTLLIAVSLSIAARLIPNSYKAEAVILVDPGKVPESYVKSTATLDAKERLAILQAQILSGPQLAAIAGEVGLTRGLSEEAVVAEMTKNVAVEPVTIGLPGKDLQAFKISFDSSQAALAARVTNRLASLFIEENLKVREQQVLGTADFFDRELQKAKQDLDEKAQNLAQLRSRFVAALPASQNLHLQALTAAQLEVRSEIDAIERAQQQKVYLQSLATESPSVVDLDRDSGSAGTAGLEDERERLSVDLDQLRTRYGPSYPDVLAKQAEIEDLDKQIKNSEAVVPPKPAAKQKPHNPALESQMAQLDDEIRKHEVRDKELKAQIAYYQSSLETVPGAEQQLSAATNEYSNAEDRYKRLEEHKFAADMSSDVETRQKGERFILLDPAQPPEHPYFPNRPLIDGLALGGGLVIGVFLAFARDMMDGTVKTQRELADCVQAPLFAEIPWFGSLARSRSRRALSVLAASGTVTLALGYLGLFAQALGYLGRFAQALK